MTRTLLSERQKIVKTLAERRESLQLQPNDAVLLNGLAWMLATNPNPSLRNGNEAVGLTERALKVSSDNGLAILDTLAAAYAEVGRFPEAAATATRARELAVRDGKTALAERIGARLELYRSQTAFRDMGKQ